ncbi:hypothetical protein N9M66_04410 [Litoreibacter sp.]|nr:hypothetical protein [Litoreibacter sp.]
MSMNYGGYKEAVDDEQLIVQIESGIQASSGDWLNSSDLSRERLKSTYEYAGVPMDHLAPQGVSTIVDTSTTEVIEAYTAVLSDLFLSNGKLARFVPYDDTPGAFQAAKDASNVVNYCIFKKNKGWEILQTWMKSSLLWKNAIIRWDYIEDYDYVIEEFDEIDEAKLDEILADENIEIVNELTLNPTSETISYIDVRLRKKIDKSRIKLECIPPESFRISNEAREIEDANYVGIQSEMTRSEVRQYYPEWGDSITEEEWAELDTGDDWLGSGNYSEDVAARKEITGQRYWQGYEGKSGYPLEANQLVTLTESWIRVDRDGDGIAELKHLITVGNHILFEEDCERIPLASIVPIDIPHEFFGLSMADFTRSSTLASTAILRGFVENTYLTNYSPKLADPNVVDFSALQNMKPKQIIPTNGNPSAAVASLPPEAISTGTVPLLEHLQMIKEQATGMSKAAQGLNDTLYVSGNSEQKLSAVQSAAQKRIQHIGRRFAETGFKHLITGIYETMVKNMKAKQSIYSDGVYRMVDISKLPKTMDVEIFLDIGENSNSTKIQKLGKVGSEILPALNQQGMGLVIKPEAAATLATQLIESMQLNSNDYLEDYTTEEFRQRAAEDMQKNSELQNKAEMLKNRKAEADAALAESNVAYTDAQSKNTMDDNAKQLAVSIDKHFQEWADLTIKATKEGAELPPHPDYASVIMMARELLNPSPPPMQEQGQQPMMEEQPQEMI